MVVNLIDLDRRPEFTGSLILRHSIMGNVSSATRARVLDWPESPEVAVPPDGSPLFPLPFPARDSVSGIRYGFIDRVGALRISPTWDADAGEFREGLALVARSHVAPPTVSVEGSGDNERRTEVYDMRRYGFVDLRGNLVVGLAFFDAGDFSEGLARVQDPKTKQWGFIDCTGSLVISFTFLEAGDFHQNRAMVRFQQEPGKLGFIDRAGALTIPCIFDGPSYTHFTTEDLAWVRVRGEDGLERDGYINSDGGFAIEPVFELVQPFSEGLACVRKTAGSTWVFIDTKGDEIFDTGSDDCHSFSEGSAAVRTGPSEWRYVDRTGRSIAGLESLKYLRCGVFRNGVAWVCDQRRNWGLIDRTGKVVVRPGIVRGIGRFEDGIAMVEDGDGRVGYTDSAGTCIRRPR